MLFLLITLLRAFFCSLFFDVLGWSLNQPNVCTARAMYGVDVILTADKKPLVLEVQWAPDCALAVVQNKSFWNEMLGGLYLEELEKFEEL